VPFDAQFGGDLRFGVIAGAEQGPSLLQIRFGQGFRPTADPPPPIFGEPSSQKIAARAPAPENSTGEFSSGN
jgi:hypothetical protein